MAKRSRKLLGLLVVGACLYGAWSFGSGLFGTDDATISNQTWIERMPTTERDLIKYLVLVDDDGHRIGASGVASAWRIHIELFKWGLEGDRLAMFYPQTKTKTKRKVRSWRCEGEAPKPFQLCLEVRDGRATELFYSRDDWKIESADIDVALSELRASPAFAAVRDTDGS